MLLLSLECHKIVISYSTGYNFTPLSHHPLLIPRLFVQKGQVQVGKGYVFMITSVLNLVVIILMNYNHANPINPSD